jgi:antitoxin (DNA-binding transcriptional repressor) of toxin-antitoxin stability system
VKTVNTHEAKTQLSSLLAEVEERGEVFILCRNGKPIAELRPYRPERSPLRRSARLSDVTFHEDPSLPLDPADWPDDDE